MVFLAALVTQTVRSVCLGCRDPTKDGRGNAETGSGESGEKARTSRFTVIRFWKLFCITPKLLYIFYCLIFFHVSAVVMLYSILC